MHFSVGRFGFPPIIIFPFLTFLMMVLYWQWMKLFIIFSYFFPMSLGFLVTPLLSLLIWITSIFSYFLHQASWTFANLIDLCSEPTFAFDDLLYYILFFYFFDFVVFFIIFFILLTFCFFWFSFSNLRWKLQSFRLFFFANTGI